MQKEDISNTLLQYPTFTSQIGGKNAINAPTNSVFHQINLLGI